MPLTESLIKTNKLRQATHSYLACISFVDHQVGRVLDALKESPYKDNTIVILWSDHGYHIGEKGTFQKHSLWQRATHVPLIISAPGIGKGKTCSKPVELLDIYPSLIDLCMLPKNAKNEGTSLKPLMINPNGKWDKYAITTYRKQSKHCKADKIPYAKDTSHSIIGSQYHYILYSDGSEELYDLKEDPNEWRNLAKILEFNNQKTKMKNALKVQLKQ